MGIAYHKNYTNPMTYSFLFFILCYFCNVMHEFNDDSLMAAFCINFSDAGKMSFDDK